MAPNVFARRAALAGLATFAVVAPAASAAPVDNPGSFTTQFSGGHLKAIDNLVSLDFSPSNAVAVAGTVDSDGNIDVPASSLTIPPFSSSALGFPVTVQLVSQGATGKIDPATGATTLTVRGYVTLHGGPTANGEANCQVGSPASPLTIALTTGTTSSMTPMTGTPYSLADGTLKLVNDTFSLAGGACTGTGGLGAMFDSIIGSDQLGAEHNELELSGAMVPIFRPGAAPSGGGDSGGGQSGGGQTVTPPPTTPGGQGNAQQGGGNTPAPAKKCVVPNLKGKTLAKAKTALTKANCKIGKVTKKSSSKRKNTVIAQSPKARASKAKGTKIAVTLSKGPAKKKR